MGAAPAVLGRGAGPLDLGRRAGQNPIDPLELAGREGQKPIQSTLPGLLSEAASEVALEKLRIDPDLVPDEKGWGEAPQMAGTLGPMDHACE